MSIESQRPTDAEIYLRGYQDGYAYYEMHQAFARNPFYSDGYGAGSEDRREDTAKKRNASRTHS